MLIYWANSGGSQGNSYPSKTSPKPQNKIEAAKEK